MEHIRGDFLQGLQDTNRSKDEQIELLQRLLNLSKNMPTIQKDIAGLQCDLKNMESGKGDLEYAGGSK